MNSRPTGIHSDANEAEDAVRFAVVEQPPRLGPVHQLLPREGLGALPEGVEARSAQRRQFDNADITLSDISRAKKILKNKLLNIYHSRIAYPEVK